MGEVGSEEMNTVTSLSHANLNGELRKKKAMKIEALVRQYAQLGMNRMLEVGTGSGLIASYFSRMGYGYEGTYAIDVVDERLESDDFQFQQVEGTCLPYADEKFDFVISNHVIEHVGDEDLQGVHVSEIYRCLEPGGVLYLAIPNKWAFIEPHYKLPFLSWLPVSLASTYLRRMKKGLYYDCYPRSRAQVLDLLVKQGFKTKDVTLDAIRLVGDIENGGIVKKLITRIPKPFWRFFYFWMPTFIYIAHKPSS